MSIISCSIDSEGKTTIKVHSTILCCKIFLSFFPNSCRLSFSHSLTCSHTHTHTHTVRFFSFFFWILLAVSVSPTHSHSLSLSLSLSHTHTHTIWARTLIRLYWSYFYCVREKIQNSASLYRIELINNGSHPLKTRFKDQTSKHKINIQYKSCVTDSYPITKSVHWPTEKITGKRNCALM